jgi:hypothetical protein
VAYYKFKTEGSGEGCSEHEHIHCISREIFVDGNVNGDVDEDMNDPSGARIKARKCSAYLFEVGCAYDSDETSLHEEADSMSGEVEGYMRAAFTDDYKPKAAVMKAAELDDRRVLTRLSAIHTVEIYPDFRGRTLSHEAVAMLERIYGRGCDFLILKAGPMQKTRPEGEEHRIWNDAMSFPPYSPAFDQKLMSHWRKIGFNRVGRTSYMVKADEGE